MNIYRGLVHIDNTQQIWAKDTALPFMTRVMPRQRYQRLQSSWRIQQSDEDKKEGPPDTWAKLRPLLDAVLPRFRHHYHPHQHLTIDEQIIPFQGRHRSIQFMKDKPARWGFKNFVLCDAESTYALAFNLYEGKDTKRPELGTGHGITMTMVEPWFRRGHVVVADNWFGSMKLARDLLDKGTGYIGTVRRKRVDFPPDFFVPKNALKRGEHIIHQHTVEPAVTATAWGDRNVVFLVSSVSSPTKSITVQRHVEGYERVAVPAPQVVGDYQHSMRGVDRLDQQINSKRPGAKTMRWWVAIAWGIINIIVHNAYVLHRECCIAAAERPLSNYAFRLRLADQLIGSYRGRARVGRPPVVPGGGEHRLGLLNKSRECTVCSGRGSGKKRKESKYCCLVCKVHVCILCYDTHRGAS
jgi:hypothetical protein